MSARRPRTLAEARDRARARRADWLAGLGIIVLIVLLDILAYAYQ